MCDKDIVSGYMLHHDYQILDNKIDDSLISYLSKILLQV